MNNNLLLFVDLQCAIRLQVIYLQHNQLNFPVVFDEWYEIEYSESIFPFQNLRQVKHIDLSFNKLADLLVIYFFCLNNYYRNITIYMQSNNITNVMPYFLVQLALEKKWNDIQFFQKLKYVFNLENNPINCDCEIVNFWKIANPNFYIAAIREEIVSKMPGEVICSRPENLRGTKVLDLKLIDILFVHSRITIKGILFISM